MGLTLVALVLVGALAGLGLWIGLAPAARGPTTSSTSAGGERPSLSDVQTALRDAARAVEQGDNERAATILGRASAARPRDQELHLKLGESLIALSRFDEAYEQYRAAIEIGPAPAGLQMDAGTLANQAGRPSEALAHYLLAEKAIPGDARAPLYAAMVQIKLSDDSAATASLLRAIKNDPTIPEAWGTLAELSLRNDRLDAAAEQAGRARELEPRAIRWRLVEARAFKRANKPEAAAARLLALDAEQRADAGVLTTLCEALAMLGRSAQGADECELAARNKPNDAQVQLVAAAWLERAGRTDAARARAKRAVDLGEPKGADVLARLQGK